MHSRKRSSAWIEEDEIENVSLAYTPISPTNTPSKRLQNSQGVPIATKPLLKYDAQKLLSNLAFTRFYVTANFQNFNPTSSCIVLCMVPEQNRLYQALCHILPSLYHAAPTLQALAVSSGYLHPNATSDKVLQRVLPLMTAACIEATIVDDFESFRREVDGPAGCIAVISPNGTCVWSSAEVFAAGVKSDEEVESLRWLMLNALAGSRSGDVVMGEG